MTPAKFRTFYSTIPANRRRAQRFEPAFAAGTL